MEVDHRIGNHLHFPCDGVQRNRTPLNRGGRGASSSGTPFDIFIFFPSHAVGKSISGLTGYIGEMLVTVYAMRFTDMPGE